MRKSFTIVAALLAAGSMATPTLGASLVPDFIGDGFTNLDSPDADLISVTGRIEDGAVLLKTGTIFVQYAYSGVDPVPFAAFFGDLASDFDNWMDGTSIIEHVSLAGDQWENTLTIGDGAGIATGSLFIDVAGDQQQGVYVYPWNGVAIDVVQAHVIPVPATLPLLLGALGLFVVARRRTA